MWINDLLNNSLGDPRCMHVLRSASISLIFTSNFRGTFRHDLGILAAIFFFFFFTFRYFDSSHTLVNLTWNPQNQCWEFDWHFRRNSINKSPLDWVLRGLKDSLAINGMKVWLKVSVSLGLERWFRNWQIISGSKWV